MDTPEKVVFADVIDIDLNERTSDVISDGSFKSLLLSQSTLNNLVKHGFKKPSPVQVRAIPPGMAGIDMLVQAKSGTGKTLVFAILASENLNVSSRAVQKLVVAPTREIALQIGETIKKLAPKGAKIAVFTGGNSVNEDKEKLKKGVHVVVGTTGRLCQLVNDGALNLGSLSLFVLDEADKMMSGSLQEDVNFLYSCVPSMRQVAVFSATYPPHLASSLTHFLRSAMHVRLNADDVQLVGIKQFVSICVGVAPVQAALTTFASLHFKQAFLFCNKAEDCGRLVEGLIEGGIEAAAISGQLEQSQREDVIKRLKANQIKVLVSTDLTARGVDAENVDLVINMECPYEVETYFHRIGRAARYGGQGASITLLPNNQSIGRFNYLVRDGGINVKLLQMGSIDPTLTTNRSFYESCPNFTVDRKKENGREKRDDVENEDPSEREVANDTESEAEAKTEEYSDLLNKAIDLSCTLKTTPIVTEKREEEPKKKFQFVPSRSKKSTKFYMRGEMISIREAWSQDQWMDYVTKKFDITEEPFVGGEMSKSENKIEKKVMKKKTEWERGVKVEAVLSSSSSSCNGIKEYTRKDMIAISKSKSHPVWRQYAESRWNLKEDPFVADQTMRCSFTDQLRLQRQREKQQRDKVVAERNANRLRLISMGREVISFREWDGSFEDYCEEMKKEMERCKECVRRGPVVYERRDREEYKKRVEEAKMILEKIERGYEYTLKRALKEVREEGVGSEEMMEEMKEEVKVEIIEKNENGNEEVIEEEEDGVEYEDDEYYQDEEDEGEYYEEEEGEEWDEEEEEEEEEVNEDDEGRLYTAYNRNIEFARVFNAYLNTMSTLR